MGVSFRVDRGRIVDDIVDVLACSGQQVSQELIADESVDNPARALLASSA
jgi:hypothetical protein